MQPAMCEKHVFLNNDNIHNDVTIIYVMIAYLLGVASINARHPSRSVFVRIAFVFGLQSPSGHRNETSCGILSGR